MSTKPGVVLGGADSYILCGVAECYTRPGSSATKCAGFDSPPPHLPSGK